MCHISSLLFSIENITPEEISGKDVLDVGSHYYNGNFYSVAKNLKPKSFVGVDILAGKGVDVVCRGEDLVDRFGEESFDVVVATELIEHTKDWRAVISNIKRVCRTGGIVLLTTRSFGFKIHGYPNDYWRYEIADMGKIFSDFTILFLEKDKEAPGVFIKAKKPTGFVENNLASISLYSVTTNKRVSQITERDELKFDRKYKIKKKIIAVKNKLDKFLLKFLCSLFNIR